MALLLTSSRPLVLHVSPLARSPRQHPALHWALQERHADLRADGTSRTSLAGRRGIVCTRSPSCADMMCTCLRRRRSAGWHMARTCTAASLCMIGTRVPTRVYTHARTPARAPRPSCASPASWLLHRRTSARSAAPLPSPPHTAAWHAPGLIAHVPVQPGAPLLLPHPSPTPSPCPSHPLSRAPLSLHASPPTGPPASP
eukprot:6856372-Prymnesium_polylepis.1